MQVAVKIHGHEEECRSELEHEVKIYKRLAECRFGLFLTVLEAGLTALIPYLVLPWVGDSLSSVMASRATPPVTFSTTDVNQKQICHLPRLGPLFGEVNRGKLYTCFMAPCH